MADPVRSTPTRDDYTRQLLGIQLEINKENSLFELAKKRRVAVEENCVAREEKSEAKLQDTKREDDRLSKEFGFREGINRDMEISINNLNQEKVELEKSVSQLTKEKEDAVSSFIKAEKEKNDFDKKTKKEFINIDDDIKKRVKTLSSIIKDIGEKQVEVLRIKQDLDQVIASKDIKTTEDSLKERATMLSQKERLIKIKIDRLNMKYPKLKIRLIDYAI